MVKGVSNTGSKLFEKIVFYVTPEYGTLSAKQLKKAASSFSFNYDEGIRQKNLRNRIKRKKIKRALVLSAVLAAAAAVIALIIIL